MIKRIKKTIIVTEETRYEIWCGAKGCNEVLVEEVGMPLSGPMMFPTKVSAQRAAKADGWYATYRHHEKYSNKEQAPSFVRCPKCVEKHMENLMQAEGDDHIHEPENAK